jgi:predicted N-acetyltransferase YhbS
MYSELSEFWGGAAGVLSSMEAQTLEILTVSPESRGQGIGMELLRAAGQSAIRDGAPYLRIGV